MPDGSRCERVLSCAMARKSCNSGRMRKIPVMKSGKRWSRFPGLGAELEGQFDRDKAAISFSSPHHRPVSRSISGTILEFPPTTFGRMQH